MSDASAIPVTINGRGAGVRYGAGRPFKVGPLEGYDQAVKLLAQLTRRVAAGDLEVDAGSKMSGMVMNLVRTIHYRRKSELEERRLDLLGAAAEEGAAVFQGVAIIPPDRGHARAVPPTAEASPASNTAAPVILDHGPAVQIKKPRRKK